jgi:hypothetical protein
VGVSSYRFRTESFVAITPQGGHVLAERHLFDGQVQYAVSVAPDVCWFTRDGKVCTYTSMHKMIVTRLVLPQIPLPAAA